jgi:hypothetical protein
VKKVIIITVLAVIATEAAIAGTITGTVTSDSNGLSISGFGVSCPWITHYIVE